MIQKSKSNEIILEYLKRDFGLQWSLSTLKRRLRALGIRRHANIPEGQIIAIDAVRREMEGPGQNIGYRHMQQRLRMRHNLPVRRNEVYQAMCLVDPVRIQGRKGNVCRRRDYVSCGSNWIWHLDGHDKLKPYGFPIHAAIDGFSRKILWCHVDGTNNNLKYIAKFYYEYVKKSNVIPSLTRSDAGTENGLLAVCQMFLRRNGNDNLAGEKSHAYGSSMRNQRIEAYWHNLRVHNSSYWEAHFEGLMAEGLLIKDDSLQKTCLQLIYMPLIQKELDDFVEEYNSHRIRKQRGRLTPQGVPEDLYFFPEHAGFREAGYVPDTGDIEYLGQNQGLDQNLPDFVSPELICFAEDFLKTFTCDINLTNAKEAYTALVQHFNNFD